MCICVDMQSFMILINLITFLYRYGVVLRKLDLVKEAIDVFVEAAHVLPLHWGAWLELCNLITDKEMVKLGRYQDVVTNCRVQPDSVTSGSVATRLMSPTALFCETLSDKAIPDCKLHC